MSEAQDTQGWRSRVRAILPKIAYPALYLVAFAIALPVTFPYDQLRDRLVVEFNSQQRPGPGAQELQIEELSSHWITGVKAEGVILTSAATEPGKSPAILMIDRATARISLLPLIIGRKTVSFSLEAFGGTIDGWFSQSSDRREVEVELDGVDIGRIDPLTGLLELPMSGQAAGKAHLVMPEGKASQATGELDFKVAGVTIGDGKKKLKGLMALPKIDIGDLEFSAEAAEGVLKISKFGATGKDVELDGGGRIQMREMAMQSVCDVNLKFKINDGYRTKNKETESLFGSPTSKAPPLIEMDPKVRRAKQSDGFYAFHMSGLLGDPRFDPAGGSTPGGPGMIPGVGGPGMMPQGGP